MWLAAAASLIVVAAQLQQPSPAPSKLSRPPQPQAAPSASATNSPEQKPSATPFPEGQAEAPKHAYAKEEKASKKDDEPAADRLANWLMVFFNGLLVIITIALGIIAWAQNRATRVIERGYVTISHTPRTEGYNAGGMDYRADGTVMFDVVIKNHGNTPADVLGGVVGVEFGAPGTLPPKIISATAAYDNIVRTFLVPGAHVTMRSAVASGLSQEDLRRVFEMEHPSPLDMWLVGYVCYRDRFSNEHTGGYGRHWHRASGALAFDDTTVAMNYDRPVNDHEKKQSPPDKTHVSVSAH